MGSRRLSRHALTAAAALALLILAACRGDDDGAPSESPTPTETAPRTVTPTATPDLLGDPPEDGAAAVEALERYFGTGLPACDDTLKARWAVTCSLADLDGSGKPDLAMLIPLSGPGLRAPDPAVLLVALAGQTGFQEFPPTRTEADSSEIGRTMFATVDRSGDGRPELVYLSKLCTASTCRTRVEIQSWDGTTWRDLGPADLGIDNLETVTFTGTGAESTLVMRGGRRTSLGAGPSRARTVTYGFDGTRYAETAVEHDDPEYLIHAILDADALLELERFPEAIAAYRGAIESPSLKDWKYEAEGHNGRAELYSYALFRIAIATAADGQAPTSALDEVLMLAQDELFQLLADAFRRGYQGGGPVREGCLQVTSYLATPPVPDRIDEMFDYGTGNPSKETTDICPF